MNKSIQQRLEKVNLPLTQKRGWEVVGTGDFDTLMSNYVEDMKFIMPGQNDILEGR